MPSRQDRRAHVRYQSSLEAEISVYAGERLELIESTKLRDISGGGARFASTRAKHYSIGQALQLGIHLPGRDGEEEKIECWASVIWVNDQAESPESSISIAMNYVFDADQVKSLIPQSGLPG